MSQDQQETPPLSSESSCSDLTELVCDTCFGDNLLKCVGIQKCLRCEKAYCIHFASKPDPCHFCINCFSDLKVTISDPEVQIIEHYDAVTNKTTRYERHPRGRRIKLEGGGYLFAQRMYQEMTNDAEREMFIEYHRAMLGFLLNENETKRAEKAHKAAGVKPPSTTLISTPTPIKTTVTSKTKTTVSKQDKMREQAKATLFAHYKGILSMEQIDQMLNAQMPKGK